MVDGPNQWKAWLDRHGAALVLFARQWVAGQADAEDVVQDAFVRFWKSRDRVTDPASYLYASVKHCALDWQRSRQRRSNREQATARPEVEPMFIGSLEQNERRGAVEAALIALPDKQREVLVMKIWGGLSFTQIAAALETSADTIASRYRYALAKLHDVLAEEPIV